MQDMGIEPFLLSSTLRLLVAQRLLRRLCTECRQPYQVDAETAERFEMPRDAVVYKPAGCSKCRDTGYKGRVGVFEIIRINRQLKDMIQAGVSTTEMQTAAAADGMKLLRHSAIARVASGDTSLEEAVSLCSEH